MNIIIDIQGLKDKHNHFIPKEVAVVSLEYQHQGHWIVKPPYKYGEVPRRVRIENSWLSRDHHGLEWNDGTTSVQNIERILKSFVRRASRVFTRGSEKSKYLSNLAEYCFVINLEEDEDCPSFYGMPQSAVHCIQHGLSSEHGSNTCALNNALRMKAWVSEHTESLWAYRKVTELDFASAEEEEEAEIRYKKQQEASAAAAIERDEQSTNSTVAPGHTAAFDRRIPGRSDTEGVDETDSICD